MTLKNGLIACTMVKKTGLGKFWVFGKQKQEVGRKWRQLHPLKTFSSTFKGQDQKGVEWLTERNRITKGNNETRNKQNGVPGFIDEKSDCISLKIWVVSVWQISLAFFNQWRRVSKLICVGEVWVVRHVEENEVGVRDWRSSFRLGRLTSFIQLFREKLSGKVHATILKGIVCGFQFSVCSLFTKKFERIGTKGHGNVFASAKGKQQSRFDSCSRQEQCIDHIPYYLLGLSRAHFFRQAFSK